MKKRYLVILFVVVTVLTGCTVKDNITVNYDGTVSENITITGNVQESLSNEEKRIMVENKIKSYGDVLKNRNYSYDIITGKNYFGLKVTKDYSDLCDFFGNSSANQYVYKYMKCTENDYYYEIKNATDYIEYCPQCSNWPALDSVNVQIDLPVSAEEQNADEVNDETYIWSYNKDTKNKDFYLKVSKSSLKEYKKEYIKEENSKKGRKKLITIFGVIIGVVILIVILFIFYKKYKKNKLEY